MVEMNTLWWCSSSTLSGFLHVVVLLSLITHPCAIWTQQSHRVNYFTGANIDYEDYSLVSKYIKNLSKFPKPRSTAIASTSSFDKVTPVPILKQINRHNEDGSYTYGFEGADGSFKIETKLASGEVTGKYGFVDDSGKIRVVVYDANKYGFQPSGIGITVPPITLRNETESERHEDMTEYRPEVKMPQKSTSSKRKHAKPMQSRRAVEQHRRTQQQRPTHNVPRYLVQESEHPAKVQDHNLQYLTPWKVDSLQFILGNDFREPFAFQHPNKHIAASLDDGRFDTSSMGFPIPSVFDNNSPQFQVASEYNQRRYRPTVEPPQGSARVRFTESKNQARAKLQPTFISATPVDDNLSHSTTRKSFGYGQERRSILDELMKQYAIPNGSPAIHDFSFTYNN